MTAVNGFSPLTPGSAGDRDVSEGDPITPGHKRVDRAHSSKTRRGQTQHGSHARQQQEQKTVGEYALHHLFTAVCSYQNFKDLKLNHSQFVGQADAKINRCVDDLGDGEPRVEDVCGPGADPDFDQLISALGHIARGKPRALIDTVMYWRKLKGEASSNAKTEWNQV